MSDDTERRRARAAERHARMSLSKAIVGPDEEDPHPLEGAEAMLLVARLTQESWEIAGLEVPTYTRAETPCRFVPWPLAS